MPNTKHKERSQSGAMPRPSIRNPESPNYVSPADVRDLQRGFLGRMQATEEVVPPQTPPSQQAQALEMPDAPQRSAAQQRRRPSEHRRRQMQRAFIERMDAAAAQEDEGEDEDDILEAELPRQAIVGLGGLFDGHQQQDHQQQDDLLSSDKLHAAPAA